MFRLLSFVLLIKTVSSQNSFGRIRKLFVPEDKTSQCNIYIKRLPHRTGKWGAVDIGVFAGRGYRAGDIIEVAPVLTVHRNYTSQSILEHYVTSHHPDYDEIGFGYLQLMNHDSNPNVVVVFEENPEVTKIKAERAKAKLFSDDGDDDDDNDEDNYNNNNNDDDEFDTSETNVSNDEEVFDGLYLHKYVVKASRDIPKGSELLYWYNVDKWFTQRGIQIHHSDSSNELNFADEEKLILDDPLVLPGCVRSTLEYRSGKMFTNTAIPKGETIEVYRALVLPAFLVVGSDLEAFVWFRGDDQSYKGVLFVTGYGSLYQAPESENIADANVRYEWYVNKSAEINIDSGGEEYYDEDQSDVECGLSMLVSFIATRDISSGEELTIPLVPERRPFHVHNSNRHSRVYTGWKGGRRVVDALFSKECF